MGQALVNVTHVQLTLSKGFAEFSAAFERQLGRFDPSVLAGLDAAGGPQTVRSQIEAMTGSSGLMLFQTHNHGLALRIAGHPAKAVQYVVGNPLIAIEMTQHVLGAALYAPLRVLVYEAQEGTTCVEYDLPSSRFGLFGNEQVDEVARSLDQKMEALIAAAAV